MQLLTFTRKSDGLIATFPVLWADHRANVDGEWTTVLAPSLTSEHDEALSDFAGEDVLQTIAYLWIDGCGVTSADLECGSYTIA